MRPKIKKRLAALESHTESETDQEDALLALVPLEVKRRVLEAMVTLSARGEPINDSTLKPWLSPDDWATLKRIFGKDAICG